MDLAWHNLFLKRLCRHPAYRCKTFKASWFEFNVMPYIKDLEERGLLYCVNRERGIYQTFEEDHPRLVEYWKEVYAEMKNSHEPR